MKCDIPLIYHLYIAFWRVICYLPPFVGTSFTTIWWHEAGLVIFPLHSSIDRAIAPLEEPWRAYPKLATRSQPGKAVSRNTWQRNRCVWNVCLINIPWNSSIDHIYIYCLHITCCWQICVFPQNVSKLVTLKPIALRGWLLMPFAIVAPKKGTGYKMHWGEYHLSSE